MRVADLSNIIIYNQITFIPLLISIIGTKIAYIGIGFSVRDTALDLQSVLNDHFRFVKRSRNPLAKSSSSETALVGGSSSSELAEGHDVKVESNLGFKEGQSIKINIKRGAGSKKDAHRASDAGGVVGGNQTLEMCCVGLCYVCSAGIPRSSV